MTSPAGRILKMRGQKTAFVFRRHFHRIAPWPFVALTTPCAPPSEEILRHPLSELHDDATLLKPETNPHEALRFVCYSVWFASLCIDQIRPTTIRFKFAKADNSNKQALDFGVDSSGFSFIRRGILTPAWAPGRQA
jgi:hypothetical protein